VACERVKPTIAEGCHLDITAVRTLKPLFLNLEGCSGVDGAAASKSGGLGLSSSRGVKCVVGGILAQVRLLSPPRPFPFIPHWSSYHLAQNLSC